MDSHQSYSVDGQVRARLKHQTLLQDYLDLQKDSVSKKRKLQMAKQKRETLLAEIRFLRRRHEYLLKMQSSRPKLEEDFVQQRNTDIQSKMHVEEKAYRPKDATLNNLSTPLDLNRISGGAEEEGRKNKQGVWEPLKVEKKPKNCLIKEKKMGKKRILWQDQVVLKV